MSNRFRNSLIAASAAVLLLGCEVGPDYQKPETTAPAAWQSADAAMPNADKNTQAQIEQHWWKNFNDPILSQLIDKALEGNYDLKIAEARIGQARAQRSSAVAALLPTGDVKGTATREANQFPLPVSFPGITKPFDIFESGFDASWELDLFGGNKRALEGASASLQASEASLADARVSLLAEVARTYVDIRQYQAQMAITDKTVDADKNTVSLTRERANAGTAPGIDLTQAEAQLEQAQAQVPNIQSQLTQAEFSMDLLIGAQPGATQQLLGGVMPIPTTDQKLVLAAPAAVIDQRPDIQAAERKLAAATAQQGVAEAQFYPDISLNGFLGFLNSHARDLFTSGSYSWIMGSSVVWPILSYGKISANAKLADAEQQEALATYQKTVLGAFTDIEKSVSAYTQQVKFRDAMHRSVDKNRRAAAVAHERYRNGMTSFLEALDADRTLYASETQLTQAEGETSADLIAVYKSLGGGWQTAAK